VVFDKSKYLIKMSENTDLRIGQKYGKWTIIEDTGKLTRQREKIYKSRSDYGEEMIVWHSNIKYGGSGYPVNQLNNQLKRKRVKKKIHNRKVPKRTAVIAKEKFEDLYYIQAKSLQDIAREYNCTRQYIYKLLKKYGIARRTKSEARKIAIEQKKLKFEKEVDGQLETVYFGDWTVNRDFFKTWTPQMAYVLGFIYADGSLDAGKKRNPESKATSTSPRCSISQKSPEILEKIKALMSCDKKLYKAKNQPRGYIYHLDLTDEEIYEDLLKLGLTPAKSLNAKFPEMPKECIRHFIRGCWDGDGSVYFEKRRPGYIRASYTSGSKQFIKRIVLELYKVGIGKYGLGDRFYKNHPFQEKLTIYRHPYKQARYIRISGKENCQRLFHYFYDNVDESLYLKRKHEVFKKGLDLLKKKQ
jgi:hypothetical protein